MFYMRLVILAVSIHCVLCPCTISSSELERLRNAETQMKAFSRRFVWLMEEQHCMNLYRDYLPSVEDRLDKKNIPPEFAIENFQFCNAMKLLYSTDNKVLLVYGILRKEGLKLINREACELAYMTEKEFYGEVPKDIQIIRDDKIKKGILGSLYKCESWIHLIYAIRQSNDHIDKEISAWKTVIINFEKTTNMSYPFLAQRVLYGKHLANKYHHMSRHVDIMNEPSTTTYEKTLRENIFNLKVCLNKVDKYSQLYVTTTSTIEPPVFQTNVPPIPDFVRQRTYPTIPDDLFEFPPDYIPEAENKTA